MADHICKRDGCDLPKWVHGGDYCPRHAVPERIRHNLPGDHATLAYRNDATTIAPRWHNEPTIPTRSVRPVDGDPDDFVAENCYCGALGNHAPCGYCEGSSDD